uniref:Alpha-1,6-mannosyl-glycoprotein 6-beta-N-acetylglucosaminyltransferase n=1 Tax=Noctiluca scintillans TaxID=2966 RepID=A0A7S1FCD4_NOCSC|mmetsp:Transcript_52856/g.141207  ORF Transcript_52856/g.141207 Transcript_52856/m.141207 type:complete len:113 (+) Transcript_52856:65-403(+)
MRVYFLALFVLPTQSLTWVKGAKGADCNTVCSSRDGCDENAWPKSLGEFEDVLEISGYTCEGIQSGGAPFDPSTDGTYCGWEGVTSSRKPRCGEKTDSGTFRFCPCVSDREL